MFSQIAQPDCQEIDIDVVTKEPSLTAKKYDARNTKYVVEESLGVPIDARDERAVLVFQLTIHD